MLHAENPCVHFIVTHLVEQIIPDKVDWTRLGWLCNDTWKFMPNPLWNINKRAQSMMSWCKLPMTSGQKAWWVDANCQWPVGKKHDELMQCVVYQVAQVGVWCHNKTTTNGSLYNMKCLPKQIRRFRTTNLLCRCDACTEACPLIAWWGGLGWKHFIIQDRRGAWWNKFSWARKQNFKQAWPRWNWASVNAGNIRAIVPGCAVEIDRKFASALPE